MGRIWESSKGKKANTVSDIASTGQ